MSRSGVLGLGENFLLTGLISRVFGGGGREEGVTVNAPISAWSGWRVAVCALVGISYVGRFGVGFWRNCGDESECRARDGNGDV